MKEKLAYVIAIICAALITLFTFAIVAPAIIKLTIQDFIRYLFIKVWYK